MDNLVARLRKIEDAYLDEFPVFECQQICPAAADEIELLRKIETHNSAKAQLLHDIYQSGILDRHPWLKDRAYKLLGGRLPDSAGGSNEK